MKHIKISIMSIIFFILCFATSCSTSINLDFAQKRDVLSFETLPSNTLSQTMLSISGVSSAFELYNAPSLQKYFAQQGFDLHTLAFPGLAGFAVTLSTETLDLPSCTKTNTSFEMLISPETMQDILTIVPKETAQYADLLMAPIITGEELTHLEYEEIIGSLYGNDIKDELKEARISFAIKAPKNIKFLELSPSSIGTVEKKDTTALFSLSLSKFLSNYSGIKFRIEW